MFTARKAASRTTGSAVRGGFKSAPGVGARALLFVPGDLGPDEIMASVPEGRLTYVQTVSGLHSGTNIVSGDFSVGADGLMVRGGELAEPVREITIVSTPSSACCSTSSTSAAISRWAAGWRGDDPAHW